MFVVVLDDRSSSKYGLEDDTVDFIGHALALHRDDSYLDEPAIDTVKRMKVRT
jgi:Rab GDP dissociation inhibitor